MTLLGCFAVYIVSGEWLSWVLLTAVLMLPWLSLLLSLPALWDFRVSPTGVEILQMGEEAQLWLLGSCAVPMPPFRGHIRLRRCFTGEQWRYQAEKGLPTEHCGGLRVSVEKARVCDYMGLFTFPPRRREEKTILIRPAPVQVAAPSELEKLMALRWRPKPGGGFSENHELRDYHPGDSMNGIHWKLSAKTGNLMVREPMEPEQGRMILTLDLAGSPEELDRKLGRLVWLGQYMLEQSLRFEIRALTGQGLLDLSVGDRRELDRAVDDLLCRELAPEGTVKEHSVPAFWQYHIGGEPDEV